MMPDEQDRAESLDDGVIADDEAVIPANSTSLGDERFERFAALDEEFPPDQPMGVEDPGRFEIEDDVSTRDARRADEDEDTR